MKNKLNRRIATLLTFTVITTVMLQAQVVSRAQSHAPVGKLRGVVVDTQRSSYPVPRIRIRGKRIRQHFSTNEEGHFEIELPAGEYEVTIKQQAVFRRFRRKGVIVRASEVTEIKIVLEGILSVD